MKPYKQHYQESLLVIKQLQNCNMKISEVCSKYEEALLEDSNHPVLVEKLNQYESIFEDLYRYITQGELSISNQIIIDIRNEIALKKEFNR